MLLSVTAVLHSSPFPDFLFVYYSLAVHWCPKLQAMVLPLSNSLPSCTFGTSRGYPRLQVRSIYLLVPSFTNIIRALQIVLFRTSVSTYTVSIPLVLVSNTGLLVPSHFCFPLDPLPLTF
jgi:hypothetical protein